MEMIASTASDPSDHLKDHPDQNYYSKSIWAKDAVFFLLIHGVLSSFQIVVLSSQGNEKLITFVIPSGQLLDWLPLNQFLALQMFILYAMWIEDKQTLWWKMRKRGLRILIGCCLLLSGKQIFSWYVQVAAISTYATFCFISRVAGEWI